MLHSMLTQPVTWECDYESAATTIIFIEKPNHMKGDANHLDEMFMNTNLGHYKQNKQFDCLGAYCFRI